MQRLLILVGILAALAAAPARADSLAEVRAGNAAFAEGRYEPAIEAYTRAILAGDLEPEALAVTFNNRGVAYGELGDYDRAIQDYNQALTLRPGDTTSIKNLRIGHARRGSAHANLGEQDQALADYSKAIELEPQHAPTYVRRGQLRLERNEPELAVADLRKAQELDPANREAAELLARAEASVAAATPAAPPPGVGDAGGARGRGSVAEVGGAAAGHHHGPADAGTGSRERDRHRHRTAGADPGHRRRATTLPHGPARQLPGRPWERLSAHRLARRRNRGQRGRREPGLAADPPQERQGGFRLSALPGAGTLMRTQQRRA